MECARVLVSTSLFAGITLGATTAFAEDEGLRLVWKAPAGCPSGDDVTSATLKSVDRGKMLGGTLLAEANVEQLAPESWRVRLRTRRGDNAGERQIEGPTCAGVADATAVILALALVPPTTLEEPAAPAPTPARERPAVTPPRSNEPHAVAAGIAFVGNAGGLPKLGTGGALSLAWTPWRVRVEAEGKLFIGQTDNVPGLAVSADFALKEIGGRGCFVVVRGASFDVAPCLGMAARIMTANGRDSDALQVTGSSTTRVWATFEPGLMGRIFLTNWLAMRARVDLDIPLYQPDFRVTNQGRVFQPPRIGAEGNFGAEVLFL